MEDDDEPKTRRRKFMLFGFFLGFWFHGTCQRTRFSAVGETLRAFISLKKQTSVRISRNVVAFFLVGAEQEKIPFVFTHNNTSNNKKLTTVTRSVVKGDYWMEG